MSKKFLITIILIAIATIAISIFYINSSPKTVSFKPKKGEEKTYYSVSTIDVKADWRSEKISVFSGFRFIVEDVSNNIATLLLKTDFIMLDGPGSVDFNNIDASSYDPLTKLYKDGISYKIDLSNGKLISFEIINKELQEELKKKIENDPIYAKEIMDELNAYISQPITTFSIPKILGANITIEDFQKVKNINYTVDALTDKEISISTLASEDNKSILSSITLYNDSGWPKTIVLSNSFQENKFGTNVNGVLNFALSDDIDFILNYVPFINNGAAIMDFHNSQYDIFYVDKENIKTNNTSYSDIFYSDIGAFYDQISLSYPIDTFNVRGKILLKNIETFDTNGNKINMKTTQIKDPAALGYGFYSNLFPVSYLIINGWDIKEQKYDIDSFGADLEYYDIKITPIDVVLDKTKKNTYEKDGAKAHFEYIKSEGSTSIFKVTFEQKKDSKFNQYSMTYKNPLYAIGSPYMDVDMLENENIDSFWAMNYQYAKDKKIEEMPYEFYLYADSKEENITIYHKYYENKPSFSKYVKFIHIDEFEKDINSMPIGSAIVKKDVDFSIIDKVKTEIEPSQHSYSMELPIGIMDYCSLNIVNSPQVNNQNLTFSKSSSYYYDSDIYNLSTQDGTVVYFYGIDVEVDLSCEIPQSNSIDIDYDFENRSWVIDLTKLAEFRLNENSTLADLYSIYDFIDYDNRTILPYQKNSTQNYVFDNKNLSSFNLNEFLHDGKLLKMSNILSKVQLVRGDNKTINKHFTLKFIKIPCAKGDTVCQDL